ncbi:tRNA cyclic N6-threonylcarbamoyladenosine(37) synthase TcdA [Thorsellia anophelis]|nr:tRNA cyclic N6-threonylcarbamoyladenosine(37) synthase TcdA [Thorsellia anophelis]
MTGIIKSNHIKTKPDLTEAYLRRFSGIGRLYGFEALNRFNQAHICVIGIGGVGTWIVEALARTGIGFITIIDLDEICLTNTNRQIHATKDTIGLSKVSVMRDRVLSINPECVVTGIDDFICEENMVQLLSLGFDYVIDAIDSVSTKASVLAYCRRNKIKVITIGGAGGQIDPTQIQVADISKVVQDPLISKVRSILKSKHKLSQDKKGKFGIDCVFSTEQLRYPEANGEVCFEKKQLDGSMRMDCSNGFGAVTMVTASFGFVAVSHILKKILSFK